MLYNTICSHAEYQKSGIICYLWAMDLVQEKTSIISLGLKSKAVLGHILEGEGKTES